MCLPSEIYFPNCKFKMDRLVHYSTETHIIHPPIKISLKHTLQFFPFFLAFKLAQQNETPMGSQGSTTALVSSEQKYQQPLWAFPTPDKRELKSHR